MLYSSEYVSSVILKKRANRTTRHEIAFVFGQLLSPHSVPSLLKVLEDVEESEMVRHEAAEALGGIATPEVLPYLREWMAKEDAPRVVRESCQIAIDMWEVRNINDFRGHNGDVITCAASMRILKNFNTPTALETRLLSLPKDIFYS